MRFWWFLWLFFDLGDFSVVEVGDSVAEVEHAIVVCDDEDGAIGSDGDLS